MARLVKAQFTRYFLLLFVGFLPFAGFAQGGIISGKIVAAGGTAPVARASVFLNNATFGTSTADDGTFTLRGVKPGQYDLIVTILGYEEYTQKVMADNKPIELNISLTPKVMMMREVVIMTNADWKKNYEQFKRDFIGLTENSRLCKVANPRVLNLNYSRKTQTLDASTDEFLVVENDALGYRVKFLLKEFTSDNISNTISYAGRALFEDLPGNATQKAKWKLKRDEAYYGSSKHFYRSLYRNKLAEEGFVIYDFSRSVDPRRPPEQVIQHKLKQFNGINRDSIKYWLDMEHMPRWYQEHLAKPPLKAFDVLRTTPQQGIFAITFPHYLYVVYTKRHETTDFKDLYRPLDMENFETSVITLYGNYAIFDTNGSIIDHVPLNEGTWSKAKLGNLLPVDYEPSDKIKD